MAKIELEVGFNKESLQCLQDCIILIKWRSCQPLSESERVRLAALVANYGTDKSMQLRINEHWESIGGIE